MRSTPNRHRQSPALRERSPPDAGQALVRRNRLLGGAFTAGVHLIVFAALFWPHAKPPPAKPSLALTLVSIPELPKPEPPGPPTMTEAKANTVHPVPPRLAAPVLAAAAPDNSDILSESQLSGAAGAGEGGANGGGCDMARAVQQALRRDPLVHTAVEGANRLGKAVMMWNGDWVRSGSQDGKGLSAVRQAIMWEVAFAPQACRNERMHRPVLLSLVDGSTRFAIGSGDWRWSDLLGVHTGPPNR